MSLTVAFFSVIIQISEPATFKRANLAIPGLQFLVDAPNMDLQSGWIVKTLVTVRTLVCPLLGCVNLPYVTYEVKWVIELSPTLLADCLLI